MTSRCQLCKELTLVTLSSEPTLHHETLLELKTTAGNGCDLCQLFWTCLTNKRLEADIEACWSNTNTQITIRPSDLDLSVRFISTQCPLFNAIWVTCGECATSESSLLSGKLELFTKRGNAISSWISGREITFDPSSTENFTDINTWISACAGSHDECSKPTDTPLPSRVIDVGPFDGSREPRIRLTGAEHGKYIALSYCWGKSAGLTTNADTLNEYTKRIALTLLPTTIRHAILITRCLKIRYLWVDGLCILQKRYNGDYEAEKDWQRESLKMADVYSNAWLTIAADCATDKQDGIFMRREMFSPSCVIEQGENLARETVSVRLPTPFENRPLSQRAWTFQEGVLSQRLLVYGKRKMYYVCRTKATYEDSLRSDKRKGEKTIQGPGFFQWDVSPGDQTTVRDHFLQKWYSSLSYDFSGRFMTCESDKLVALAGFARTVQKKVGGDYYAGLWSTDLIFGLLWRNRNILPIFNGGQLKRPTAYRAPSWSWAAVDGWIWYPTNHRNSTQDKSTLSRVLDIHVDLVGPLHDPLGQVSGGSLKIVGPLRTATTMGPAGYSSNLQLSVRKNHHHLLLTTSILDGSDPPTVRAVLHFDIEEDADKWPVQFSCLLLTHTEGLILQNLDVDNASGPGLGPGPRRSRRCGVFRVRDENWFRDAPEQEVTIV